MTDKLKAVIFDMDGVITNTVYYHFLSWQRLAREENIDFSAEDNDKLLGLSRDDSLTIFLKGREIFQSERSKLLERKNRYFLELISNLSEKDLLPGVYELILNLKHLGLKLGIASSSKNCKMIIEKLGVTSLFDSITDGNEVTKAKPAPDLFLIAAARLKTAPEKCLVIEDSAAGIEAALQANMSAIGIGPEERVGKAHFRFDSMADIDLNQLNKEII
jgi:beta-phosphoglucomutase